MEVLRGVCFLRQFALEVEDVTLLKDFYSQIQTQPCCFTL